MVRNGKKGSKPKAKVVRGRLPYGTESIPPFVNTLRGSVREKGSIMLENAYQQGSGYYATVVPVDGLKLWNRRLGKLMRLFEYWTFHNLIIRFVPTLAPTAAGTITFYFETDPQQLIGLGLYAEEILDNANACRNHVTRSGMCSIPQGALGKKLFTNFAWDNVRTCSPGKLVYVADTAQSTSTVIGTFFLDYDVTLSAPQNNVSGWDYELETDLLTSSGAITTVSTAVIDATNDPTVTTANTRLPGNARVGRTDPSRASVDDLQFVRGLGGLPRILPYGEYVKYHVPSGILDDTADTWTPFAATTTYIGLVYDLANTALRWASTGADTLQLIDVFQVLS
jgi:hypothetical protein